MIKKEMVFINEELHSRSKVIHFIAQQAFKHQFISNCDHFVDVVFERERQIATSVGHDIAIPHGKSEVVIEPFVAYVRVQKPFEWDESTNDMVQSIFLIGVPEKDAGMTHLRYISQVSRKLMNDDFRNKLFACETIQNAFVLLDSINDEILKDKGDK